MGMDVLDPHTPQTDDLVVDGISINVFSMPEAVASIVSAAERGENFSVCTLNLDHVAQLQRRPDFRAAYRRARFVTADGFPIVILGRLAGTRITRTTGADLVAPICQQAGQRKVPVLSRIQRSLASSRRAAIVEDISRPRYRRLLRTWAEL